MPQRQPPPGQPGLERGAEEAGVEPGGQRLAVDLLNGVHAGEVERYRGGEALPQGLDPSDDGRAAPERNDRNRRLLADRDDPRHLLGRGGADHRVGRARAVPRADANQIGVALSQRHERPAPRGPRRGRCRQARLGRRRGARAPPGAPPLAPPAACAPRRPRPAPRADAPPRPRGAPWRGRPRPTPTTSRDDLRQPAQRLFQAPPHREAHLQEAQAREAAQLDPGAGLQPRCLARPAEARSGRRPRT